MEIREQLLKEFLVSTISDLGYDLTDPYVFETYEVAVHFGAIASRKELLLFLEARLTEIKGV